MRKRLTILITFISISLLFIMTACSNDKEVGDTTTNDGTETEDVSENKTAQDVDGFFKKEDGVLATPEQIVEKIKLLEYELNYDDIVYDVKYEWLGEEEVDGEMTNRVYYKSQMLDEEPGQSSMSNDEVEVWYNDQWKVVKAYDVRYEQDLDEFYYDIYEGENSFNFLDATFTHFHSVIRPQIASQSRTLFEHKVENSNILGHDVDVHLIHLNMLSDDPDEGVIYHIADFGDFEMMIHEEMFTDDFPDNVFDFKSLELRD